VVWLDIVITANSPGEVAAWVKPAAKELKKVYPGAKMTVFLPPCVFASGSEKRVLQQYQGIDMVYDRREYLQFILLRKSPAGFTPGKQGIVIFLGGDLFHAVLLGNRLNYPVIAYTEGVYNWGNRINRFMVPDERTRDRLIKKGAPAEKVKLIGNLMLDAIEPEMSPEEVIKFLELKDELIITLFPGSRPAEVKYMLPFFLEAISDLLNIGLPQKPNPGFLLSLSPFVEVEYFREVFNNYIMEKGLNGSYLSGERMDLIKIGNRLEIKVLSGQQYSLMQITDLALTIPGTNNLELAFFGTPMLVLLPLNKPEDIPLEGLPGLLGSIPVIGPALKRRLVPRIASKMEYVSLINRIAGKEIVPEVRGVLRPEDLSREMAILLKDRQNLKEMSDKLTEAVGQKGAVQKLTNIVTETLASYHQNRL